MGEADFCTGVSMIDVVKWLSQRKAALVALLRLNRDLL